LPSPPPTTAAVRRMYVCHGCNGMIAGDAAPKWLD
jgi:hypothetical protein